MLLLGYGKEKEGHEAGSIIRNAVRNFATYGVSRAQADFRDIRRVTLKEGMRREELLALIRQKCIEANPEIIELKFGCVVKLPIKSNFSNVVAKKFGSIFWKYDDNKFRFVGERGWLDVNLFQEHRDKFQIIGRPIRLADVLLAIDDWPQHHNPILWWTKVEGLLGIRDAGMKELLFFICTNWNLRKDNLNDQSDECVSFIAELLK